MGIRGSRTVRDASISMTRSGGGSWRRSRTSLSRTRGSLAIQKHLSGSSPLLLTRRRKVVFPTPSDFQSLLLCPGADQTGEESTTVLMLIGEGHDFENPLVVGDANMAALVERLEQASVIAPRSRYPGRIVACSGIRTWTYRLRVGCRSVCSPFYRVAATGRGFHRMILQSGNAFWSSAIAASVTLRIVEVAASSAPLGRPAPSAPHPSLACR